MMKRYAVLHAPNFRLQAVLRFRPQLRDKPAGLLEVQGAKSRVMELNAPARQAGVTEGMTPTQATARCESIQLLGADRGQERSAQDALLQTAETISPFLEATEPGVVTVEWPSEKSFQEHEVMERWIQPLRLLGLSVGVGMAETPGLAWIAARCAGPICRVEDGASFLRPLPLELLGLSDELRVVLHSWGIRSIGELLALPARDTCQRLGREAVRLEEAARGGTPRPLRLVKPREFFSERTDLEHPLEILQPLLFLIRRLLEQMARRLAHAHLVAGKIRFILRLENGPPHRRVFTLPQPTREVELLFRMLQAHLENFHADSPVLGLELAAQPVRPGAEQFSLLEKGVRDPHQLSETLARLEGLLGEGRVGTPELEASHHPDAFHLRGYECRTFLATARGEPPPGLSWFKFRPPVPAEVTLVEARPRFLCSACSTSPIREAHGPWFLEGNWWEKRRWSREEWDIATNEGAYRLVRSGGGWFLDGIYA